VTPSHQFPLGVHMPLTRRLALLKWAADARAWIVEDDYDSEFRYGTRPVPCLHGLDVDGRVIYVGSFSKSLFPALRLGFVIVPSDLQDKLREARRAADHHPSLLEQTVLADFIEAGHYERHLRRMRALYRERLEALADGVDRFCRGALRLRPVRTGLHAVADLAEAGVDAERVAIEAAARGVELTPLSAYYMRNQRLPNAVVLGFGSVGTDAIRAGTERLAEAMAAARRPQRAQPGSRSRAYG